MTTAAARARRRFVGLCALAACAPLATAHAQAEKERAEVPEAAPVTAGGVRYQAPPFTRAQGLPRNGGYVEAVDTHSGRRLWIVDVVGPAPDDGREGDKQDCFITALALSTDGRHLEVTDERGRRYRLDLHSRRVRRLPAR